MKVEIWSDVVCPWCYIGKRRFEAALARFAHRDDVDVVWRSFELDPSAPALRDVDNAERLAAKYGMSRQQAVETQNRLTQTAAAEGLTFRFDVSKSGNTFNAHRLLHLASERGLQDELKERLMRAYFSEAEPIGDNDALVRLAAEVGIPSAEARAVLSSDTYSADVRAEEREASELGINGVPFFVIDRRYGVSGAQSPDVLLQALDQAWADAHPSLVLTPVGVAASDAACTDDTCAL
ncbi:MAG TPA: DsbA family oxidoreductase [Chloroflexota bacterium]|nr:DsbA family oxidoreductase [Chloroflexota bacterium]